tara:strand:- start:43 stop:426 length:384 start_codon:yes stop_codon:yes gene_type:complete
MALTIDILSQRVEVLEKQMAALLADNSTKIDDKPNNKTMKEDKPKKKTKKEDKEDKPKKKRVSGYLLFSKVNRDEVKQELFGDEKPKNSDIMVELGKRWKALDDEEREEWNTQAKQAASEDSAEEQE